MNRQRPQNDDRILSFFTSGQLIAGLCTLIFYTLLIFLIGIVVGRMDPSGKVARIPEEKSDVVVSTPEKIITEKPLEKPVTTGKQTSPRPPDPAPVKKTTAASKPEKNSAAPVRSEKPLQKNTQTHPTLIPNTKPPRPPIATKPATTKKAAAPKEAAPAPDQPAETVATVLNAAQPEEIAIVAPKTDKPAEVKPTEPTAVTPEKAPEAVVIPGNFAVQIAAFTDVMRKEKAAKFLATLHEDKLNAISLSAKNGTVSRLLVVGFKNLADAKTRCQQIQQMDKAYAQAYARKLYPEEVQYLTQGNTP